MSITPTQTTNQGQGVLAQYQLSTRTAALQRLAAASTGDSATFGSRSMFLADIANGTKAATVANTETASIINRLPSDPKKLARMAQQMDAQVAQLKKRGQTDKASTLMAFADAVRQRAKVLTAPAVT
jgi:hypothetical protein